MSDVRYVIKRDDQPGMMLQCVCICRKPHYIDEKTEWTKYVFWAYKFVNEKIAQAVIDFIRDVLDFELAECLFIEEVPGNE